MAQTSKIRFAALDGWRGSCALLVAAHNAGCSTSPFLQNASLFVDFFFVLSGFVITHAYMTQLKTYPAVGVFMIRRFGRLWPLHVAVLVAFIGLEFLKLALAARVQMPIPPFTGSNSVAAILPNALMLQSLFIHSPPTWNIPSWSISTEFWTYLVFAATCFYWPRRPPPVGLMAGIALLAASLIIWLLPNLETNSDYALVRCIYGFFVGHLVYRAWEHGPSKIPAASVLETSALLTVLVFVYVAGAGAWSIAAPLVFGFAVWVFAYENGAPARVLSSRPFVQLGLWSYSIYMVHWLVLSLIARSGNLVATLVTGRPQAGSFEMLRTTVCSGTWSTTGVLVGYLTIVVVVASLTYRFIERPGRVYFNGLADRLSPSSLLQGSR